MKIFCKVLFSPGTNFEKFILYISVFISRLISTLLAYSYDNVRDKCSTKFESEDYVANLSLLGLDRRGGGFE